MTTFELACAALPSIEKGLTANRKIEAIIAVLRGAGAAAYRRGQEAMRAHLAVMAQGCPGSTIAADDIRAVPIGDEGNP